MSNEKFEDEPQKKAVSEKSNNDSFTVGYRKPPDSGKFKKGQPSKGGRPKGSKNKPNLENVFDIILDQANQDVDLRQGNTVKKVKMIEAIIQSINHNALKGNHKSQVLALNVVKQAQAEARTTHAELVDTIVDYQRGWRRSLEVNPKGPQPILHPDEIIISLELNAILITGPLDENMKAEREHWIARRDAKHREVESLKKELSDPDCEYRDIVEWDLAASTRYLELLERMVTSVCAPIMVPFS